MEHESYGNKNNMEKTYGEYMETHSETHMVKKQKKLGRKTYAETGGKHVNLSMDKQKTYGT